VVERTLKMIFIGHFQLAKEIVHITSHGTVDIRLRLSSPVLLQKGNILISALGCYASAMFTVKKTSSIYSLVILIFVWSDIFISIVQSIMEDLLFDHIVRILFQD